MDIINLEQLKRMVKDYEGDFVINISVETEDNDGNIESCE